MKFSDLIFETYEPNWIYTKVWFPNGYGVSIIRCEYSKGYLDGLYEMAIITGNGDEYYMNYDTSITDSVLGWLTEADVEKYIEEVSKLEEFKP